MALNHNIVPSTSTIFAARDFVPQLEVNQKQNREGLQNLFKLLMQAHDYAVQRDQANQLEEQGKLRQQQNIDMDNDMARLAELKQELAALQGGV